MGKPQGRILQLTLDSIINMFPAKPYVSGTGNAPPAKKSSVAQTCNQLSLFLKDKAGCLKDLHFGINSKFDDSVKSPTTKTIDLLSNMENLGENTHDKPLVAASEESKTKQMTIFYNGQVIVVDDISEDRAKEVMLAATATATATNNANSATLLLSKTKAAPSSSEHLGSNNQRINGGVQLQANGLDLPIARRASLHKFLAKRRDRANYVRPEPYQLHNIINPSSPPASGSHKYEHKFDLNL